MRRRRFASGKDLNWFWNNWYFTNGYIDLGVKSAVKAADGYTVTIDNIGGFVAPVDLVLTYSDGSTETLTCRAGSTRRRG